MEEALKYIKSKHNGEIPYKYGSNECARLMQSYAEFYHELKLKKNTENLKDIWLMAQKYNLDDFLKIVKEIQNKQLNDTQRDSK